MKTSLLTEPLNFIEAETKETNVKPNKSKPHFQIQTLNKTKHWPRLLPPLSNEICRCLPSEERGGQSVWSKVYVQIQQSQRPENTKNTLILII